MKVLFIAEAATLAHVGRSLKLACGMHQRGFDVELALGAAKGHWEVPFAIHRLRGIGSERFGAALAAGSPVLDVPTLMAMVDDDLRLLARVKPDVVIGDFRLSLSISARVSHVRYATLTNAYWSPNCRLPLPMPVLPLSRWTPLPMAQALFDFGKRFALPLHCRPLNQVRGEYGLPSLGHNIRVAYTDADDVLFADVPGMFPMERQSPREHFLGPILWSPDVALPAWWHQVPTDQPIIYVSVGSSGDPTVLRRLVESLAELPVQLLVSSAGSAALETLQKSNVHVAKYLPGDQAAAKSSLVVCNGGSMGCQQALAHGVPVLGVCGNMDQFLNMAALVAAGCGRSIRADRVRASALQHLVGNMLRDTGLKAAAVIQARALNQHDPVENLARWLAKPRPPVAPSTG